MSLKRITLAVLVCAAAASANAQLVFSNITAAAGASGTNLSGATTGGVGLDSFVTVGAGAAILHGNAGTADFQKAGAWVRTNLSSGFGLRAVTYGAGTFAAGGSNNVVFFSADGQSWQTNTINSGKVLNNTIELQGLAFNGGRFAAAPASAQLRSATSGLTNWVGTNVSPGGYQYEFLESFRAITGFGVNSFAAAGIQGIIRVSTNGGTLWNSVVAIEATTNRSVLLGVASDGGNTVVAVGQKGVILRCTSNHVAATNWVNVTPSPVNPDRTLTAVAYMNPGFIAVGSETNGAIINSIILTSPNGLNWVTNDSLVINQPLRGVAFGTSVELTNVALAVGDNGQVLLGGTVPDKPEPVMNLTNYLVCAEGTDSTTVSVHVPDWVTVDWFTGPVGGAPIATGIGTTNFTPTNLIPASFSSFHAQARDKRTGFINPDRLEILVTVNDILTATVFGQSGLTNVFVCGEQPTLVLEGAASGGNFGITNGSYTYHWTMDNGSPAMDLSATNVAQPILTNRPATTRTYRLRVKDEFQPSLGAGCYAEAYVTVHANSNLTATAFGQSGLTNVYVCGEQPTLVLEGAAFGGNYETNGGYLFHWTMDNGSPAMDLSATNVAQPILTNRPGTTRTYRLRVVDQFAPTFTNRCVAEAYVTVHANSNLFASVFGATNGVTNVFVCGEQPTLVLAGAAAGGNYETNGGYVFHWTDANGNPAFDLSAINVAQPILTNRPGTTRTYWLRVQDQFAPTFTNACVAQAWVTVHANSNLFASVFGTTNGATNVFVCAEQGTLELAGAAAGGNYLTNGSYTFAWSPSTGLSATNVANPTLTLVPGSTNTYMLRVLDRFAPTFTNRCVVEAAVTVHVNRSLVLSLNSNLFLCAQETNRLIASVTGGTPPFYFVWSPTNDLSNPFASNPVVLASFPSNFTRSYSLTLGDSFTNSFFGSNCLMEGSAVVQKNLEVTTTLSPGEVNCGAVSNNIVVTLAGVPPWSVVWWDGAVSNNVSSNILTRPVFIPNNTRTNIISTNFWLTSVTDSNNCSATSLGGTNTFTIYPRLSSTLQGEEDRFVATNSFVQLSTVLTGVPPFTVMWSDGEIQTSNATTISRTIFATNLIAQGLEEGDGREFYITNLADSSGGGCSPRTLPLNSEFLVGTNTITLSSASIAFVSGDTNACLGDFITDGPQVTILRRLTNSPNNKVYGSPWKVVWSDGVTNSVTDTNLPLVIKKYTTGTNYFASAEHRVSFMHATRVGGVGSQTTISSNQIAGSAIVTVYPLPQAIGLFATNAISGVPFSYSLTNTVTNVVVTNYAWRATNVPPAISGATTNSTDSDTIADLLTNASGTDVTVSYEVTATSTNGCGSSFAVLVTVAPSTVSLSYTNIGSDLIFDWVGPFILQSTTNLSPVVVWSNEFTGLPGVTNRFTNSTLPPPDNKFFRLISTNSP